MRGWSTARSSRSHSAGSAAERSSRSVEGGGSLFLRSPEQPVTAADKIISDAASGNGRRAVFRIGFEPSCEFDDQVIAIAQLCVDAGLETLGNLRVAFLTRGR